MNSTSRTGLHIAATILAITVTGALAGCAVEAPTASASPSSAARADSEAAALLPDDIRDRGYVTVATDLTYAPFGMLEADGTTPTGIDIDTASALEEVLGVDVRVENASFDAFIPGLQAGRFDAGLNAITDTEERREVADFIDFNQYGGLFLTAPDSDIDITEALDACGLTVGAELGSDTVAYLEGLSGQCQEEDREPITLSTYGSLADALVALSSDRVEAVIGGSTSGYNASQSDGQYVVNGPVLPELDGSLPVGGMVVAKDSPLADALLAALNEIYDDGTLADIYDTYGINPDILIKPVLNGG